MTSPKCAATYIGRIGALAIALGVGHALASGTAVASADTADAADQASAQQSTSAAKTSAAQRASRGAAAPAVDLAAAANATRGHHGSQRPVRRVHDDRQHGFRAQCPDGDELCLQYHPWLRLALERNPRLSHPSHELSRRHSEFHGQEGLPALTGSPKYLRP